MGVYMASGCSSMIGKMTGKCYERRSIHWHLDVVGLMSHNISSAAVWFPISAFVALGLDHSVANMFIIPLGMFRGADITVADFLMKNLIPVTLGNIVGGAICVMAPFGMSFGSWGKKKA